MVDRVEKDRLTPDDVGLSSIGNVKLRIQWINTFLNVAIIIAIIGSLSTPFGHVFFVDSNDAEIWYAEYIWSEVEVLLLYLPLLLMAVAVLLVRVPAILNKIMLFCAMGYLLLTGYQVSIAVQDYQASYGSYFIVLLSGLLILKCCLNLLILAKPHTASS